MRNLASRLRHLTWFACMLALSACTKTPVDVSSLGLKITAPQLKSTSPFDQEIDTQGYIEFSGTCSPLIDSFSVSADGINFNEVPAMTEYTVGGIATTKTNDTNCTDGNFSFFITEAQINTWLGHEMVHGEIKALYIRGGGALGQAEDLVLRDHKDEHNRVATALKISKEYPRNFATQGQCSSLRIRLVDQYSSELSASADIEFAVPEIPGGNIVLFDSMDDCQTGTGGLFTRKILNGNSQVQVHYRAANTSSTTLNLDVLLSPIPLATNSITIQNRPAGAGSMWISMEDSPHSIYKNICYPTSLALRNYDATNSNGVSHADVIALPIASDSRLKFFLDNTCSTEITTAVTLGDGTYKYGMFMQYVDTGTTATNDTQVSISTNVTPPVGLIVDDSPTEVFVDRDDNHGTITQVTLSGPNHISNADCAAYRVQVANTRWAPIPNPGPTGIFVSLSSSAGGSFYTSQTACTSGSGASAAVLLPAGSFSQNVFFKASGPGSTILTATSTGLVAGASAVQVSNAPVRLDMTALYQISPFYSEVSVGYSATCVISTTGTLYCAGSNLNGELGTGDLTARMTFVPIDLGEAYSKISVGKSHACGVTTSGVLKCWGKNDVGQVGNGNAGTNIYVPTAIDSGTSYSDVSVGDNHSCGLTTAGAVKCWGAGGYGQLGNGSNLPSDVPVATDSGSSYKKIDSGQYHTCGLTTADKIRCWGMGNNGQLGNGASGSSLNAVDVSGGIQFVDLSAGGSSSCGIVKSSGIIKCWGANTYGQLGDGTQNDSNVPVSVSSLSFMQGISVGERTTCARNSSNGLSCWGFNTNGQVGNNILSSTELSPVAIDSGNSYHSVSVGNINSCGISTSNELRCWGTNDGSFGDSSAPGTAYLVPVPNVCYRMDIAPIDSMSNVMAAITPIAINAAISNGYLFAGADCSGDPYAPQTTASITIPPGSNFGTFYFRKTGASPSLTISNTSGLIVPGTIPF